MRQIWGCEYRSCCGLCDLLGEQLELLVQHLSTLALLLFKLQLVLVAIAIFALAVTCLVELNVRRLAIELDVLVDL